MHTLLAGIPRVYRLWQHLQKISTELLHQQFLWYCWIMPFVGRGVFKNANRSWNLDDFLVLPISFHFHSCTFHVWTALAKSPAGAFASWSSYSIHIQSLKQYSLITLIIYFICSKIYSTFLFFNKSNFHFVAFGVQNSPHFKAMIIFTLQIAFWSKFSGPQLVKRGWNFKPGQAIWFQSLGSQAFHSLPLLACGSYSSTALHVYKSFSKTADFTCMFMHPVDGGHFIT